MPPRRPTTPGGSTGGAKVFDKSVFDKYVCPWYEIISCIIIILCGPLSTQSGPSASVSTRPLSTLNVKRNNRRCLRRAEFHRNLHFRFKRLLILA
jgi:hypothetical protein